LLNCDTYPEELIDGAVAQVLWARHFLALQGMFIPTTTIYQENKSSILLAKNGKTTNIFMQHLDVRYFFVTYKIKKD